MGRRALLANGAVADLVLFGSILVWAVVNYTAARRRDRAAGTVYAVGPASRDVRAVVIGLVVWAVFAFWLHGPLIGPRPFWLILVDFASARARTLTACVAWRAPVSRVPSAI